ncbi:MAG: hypothetical protein NC223_09645 [Butyrivibrio sp.]|nr:hypothetical protein [Butyrivibrio sp.]
MKENEVIEWQKAFKETYKGMPKKIAKEVDKACGMAIEALEEIQQYRSIGTVAECREAMKKQKPKTPHVWGDGYADGKLVYDTYDCPNCGESYETDCDNYGYCPKCGQRIDRSAFEESGGGSDE